MKTRRIVKAGELLNISSGQYSDYSIIALCRAKRDIDTDAFLAKYLELNPEQKENYRFDIYQFSKWLIVDHEVVEELPVCEWHLDDYGCVEEGEMWEHNSNI